MGTLGAYVSDGLFGSLDLLCHSMSGYLQGFLQGVSSDNENFCQAAGMLLISTHTQRIQIAQSR